MKKINVKKLLLSALGLTLVAVLTVAGTLAYLQDESEPIVNTFETNGITVTLTETTGDTYEIIPGTTVEKDPTVKVENTLDAYVFVEVKDNTAWNFFGDKLVNFDIATGWTELEGVKGVYYREVKADAPLKEFPVLLDNQVSFSADLGNDQMTKDAVTLSFKATAIQQAGFAGPKEAWQGIPATVASKNEFTNALEQGKKEIILGDDIGTITLPTGGSEIKNDTVINLNGQELRSATGSSALDIVGGETADAAVNVTIKNGIIESRAYTAGSALYAQGNSNVTIENCTIKSNNNKTYAVCTNGSVSTDTTIVIKNSTITAPTGTNKGYALYVPAGNVTLDHCDVTGHVIISGGNVNLIGGTYTATGFKGQENTDEKIWDKQKTITYVKKQIGGSGAFTMGDSILIVDRRNDSYSLSNVTIKDITFNTVIPAGNAYAIKYVDMMQGTDETRGNIVVENVKYNHTLADGNDPVMYIDIEGHDIDPATLNTTTPTPAP